MTTHSSRAREPVPAAQILAAIFEHADVAGVDQDGNAIVTLTVPPELLDVLATVGTLTEDDEVDDEPEDSHDREDDRSDYEPDTDHDKEPDDQDARRPHVEARRAKVKRVNLGFYVVDRLDPTHDINEAYRAGKFVRKAARLRRQARRTAP